MSVLDLIGRGALVVGGGQGMGRATALLLAEAGARVVVLDMELERAEGVAEEIRAQKGGAAEAAFALSFDVTTADQAKRAVDEAEALVRGLDIVVNIVGGASWSPLLTVDEMTWERDFNVNLKHHLYVGQNAARNWIEHERPGTLCVVASVSGIFSSGRHAAYGAAKAGVLSFVRSAAEEWWPHGIRVNAVVPGAVRTPRMEGEWAAGTTPQPADDLLDRMADPEDIAGAIAFLVSNLAKKVTGQTVVVDGGWTTRFPYALS